MAMRSQAIVVGGSVPNSRTATAAPTYWVSPERTNSSGAGTGPG